MKNLSVMLSFLSFQDVPETKAGEEVTVEVVEEIVPKKIVITFTPSDEGVESVTITEPIVKVCGEIGKLREKTKDQLYNYNDMMLYM